MKNICSHNKEKTLSMTANILKIATAIIKLNNKIHLLNPYFS